MTVETLSSLRESITVQGDVPPADFDSLVEALGSPLDLKRLKRWLRRRALGEPLEYITGFQLFRSRRFGIDKRVYITDPELTHLVDTVVAAAKQFLGRTGRAPVIVEFGVGCGSLAISVKKELPEARVIGLDIDSDAIAVAFQNARNHQVDLELFESDLFSDLPGEIVPDILFGDPPWGDDDSLYEEGRGSAHYRAMPILSAFPSGGITAVHEAILEEVYQRQWGTEVFLNLGVLESVHTEGLANKARSRLILTFDKAGIMHCIF